MSAAQVSDLSSTEKEKPYKWDSLPQENSQGHYIRYMELESGASSEPLKCKLYTTLLAELPEDVNMISYVCGSDDKVAQLICGGETVGEERTIDIGANLRDVLYRLRLPNKSKKLWVDAICIDQKNDKEKSDQVAKLGLIYREAKTTLICVGDDKGQDKVLALFLENIDIDGWDEWTRPTEAITNDWRWPLYRSLITNPWFTRVWTVQEAGLSSNAVVLYGDVEIPWSNITRVQRWLYEHATNIESKHRLSMNYMHTWGFLSHDRKINENYKKRSLLIDNLTRAKSLGCTNPRDRLYAFLSLHGTEGKDGKPMVTPDYTKGCDEIYPHFARSWLKATGDVRILSAVDHSVDSLKSKKFPTWVPRWDIFHGTAPLGLHSRTRAYAFPEEKYYTEEEIFRSGNDRRIKIRGLIVDSIKFRSGVLSSKLSSEIVKGKAREEGREDGGKGESDGGQEGARSETGVNIEVKKEEQQQEEPQREEQHRQRPKENKKEQNPFVAAYLSLSRLPLASTYSHEAERLLYFLRTLRTVNPTNSRFGEYPIESIGDKIRGDTISLGNGGVLVVPKEWHTGDSIDSQSSFAMESYTPEEAFFGTRLLSEVGYAIKVDQQRLGKQALRLRENDGELLKYNGTVWYDNRRFIVTEDGFYGLVPQVARKGDLVCVVKGLRVPVILRRITVIKVKNNIAAPSSTKSASGEGKAEGQTATTARDPGEIYKLVGEAFIFGLMGGEAVRAKSTWGLEEQEFRIY